MVAKPVPKRYVSGEIVWRVNFRLVPNGAPTSETFKGERGQQEAERFAKLVDKVGGAAARAARPKATDKITDVPSLLTFATEYVEQRAGISDGTRRDYASTVRRAFGEHTIGTLRLDAITRQTVEHWIRWYEGRGISAKTVEQARSLLAQILQAAVERDLIAKNPVRGVRSVKGTSEQMTFLTPAEFTILAAHCPREALPLVSLLYGTGMRWGEATALVWGDLDLEANPATARVWRSWKRGTSGYVLGTTKTRRSQRTVALPREIVDLLPRPGAGDEHVFVSFGQRAGAQVYRESFYKMVWRPLLDRANNPAEAQRLGVRVLGKRPRLHDLRHSHASFLIAQNIPMNIIQSRLGHESIKTTADRYGHLMPDALKVGADAASLSLAGTFPQIES